MKMSNRESRKGKAIYVGDLRVNFEVINRSSLKINASVPPKKIIYKNQNPKRE